MSYGTSDSAGASDRTAARPQPPARVLKLGFLKGSLIDHGDGTISRLGPGSKKPIWRIRVAEITGFGHAVHDTGLQHRSKGQRWATSYQVRVLEIHGHGTVIATIPTPFPSIRPRIEEWIRAHPQFNQAQAAGWPAPHGNQPQAAAWAGPPVASVADELAKLAHLRDAGVLSHAEFDAQKARLLG